MCMKRNVNAVKQKATVCEMFGILTQSTIKLCGLVCNVCIVPLTLCVPVSCLPQGYSEQTEAPGC